jgi:hypothetical protein
MQGKLFTQDFLQEGITRLGTWRSLCESEFEAFRERVRGTFNAFPAESTENEAVTESQLIIKVLEEPGWRHNLPQQTTSGKGRLEVPDILLFQDEQYKRRALSERKDERRYRHGIVIVESKRWCRPLDRGPGRREEIDASDPDTPSNQILRYLSRAEVASDKRIQWGILTNGRHWRLYYQQARSRSEEFLELDVATLAGQSGLTPDLFSPDLKPLGADHSRTPPTNPCGQGLPRWTIHLDVGRGQAVTPRLDPMGQVAYLLIDTLLNPAKQETAA